MFERNPLREIFAGGRGMPPRPLLWLLASLSVGCLADAFVELRPIADLFRLEPAVWERGQVWRIVTYGLVGEGGISAWPLFQLLLVYWFGMELCAHLGVRRVRNLLLGGIALSGAAAVVAQLAAGPGRVEPFMMMQGQSVVLAICIPAFATVNRWSTVAHTPYLFGLPIPTRWLVPLQLLSALALFAATRDTGGFVGILVATAWAIRATSRRKV